MEKLIVACAITGAEVTKENNPAVPYTTAELAESAIAACKAGASIIHLHVRRDDGTPTQDADTFRRAVRAIRAGCDAIVMVSTGGAVGMTPDERCQSLEAGSEMASLSTGSVNFGKEVFINDQATMEQIAKLIQAKKMKPEIEIFDAGMMDNAKRLIKDGLVATPPHFQFVLGVPGGLGGEVRNLTYLVDSLPAGATWSVAGVGRHQFTLATVATLMGGHVRVGLEDNIYLRKGVLAPSNAALVERATAIAREFDRPVASPSEARALLGI